MKAYSATVTIQSTADKIWSLLTNGAGYPGWNPTVERVQGEIAPGNRITIYAKVNGATRPFPVTVKEFAPGARMVWNNALPLGLFQGERTYTLTPKGEGQVEFAMREVFSGPLSPLFERVIPDLQPSFDAFAAGLKKGAEGS